jgi:hypothetical protein
MAKLLLLALLISAPAAAAPPNEDGRQIVVTGKPLRETQRALTDCLRRNCPPDQDIDSTLAHAENLFLAGEYKEARHITLASIGRNKGHARAHPLPVSDLYRANGRIAAHLGEGRSYESSILSVRRTLKAGLPKDDLRLVEADFEVASMSASLSRFDTALRIYGEVERDSRRIGREDLAGKARVMAAWVHQLEGKTWLARKALEDIADDRAPGVRMARLTALILLSRLDRKEGKLQSSDSLIGELRAMGGTKPILLYSPRIELTTRGVGRYGGSVTHLMANDNFDDRWVDVGFWVTPEGRVGDAEILRSQGSTSWAPPLLKSIAGRIYSPVADPGGTYRVERYSYTSLWRSDVTGTRMRQRSPNARIEMLDLTAEPEPGTR